MTLSRMTRTAAVLILLFFTPAASSTADHYKGLNCTGKGDREYLWLIDRSFDFFHPNPDWQILEAIADPEHEEHKSYLKWSGPFDSEAFDAEAATKAMRKGLPNWREME
jgi:hypothetical protein